KELILSDPATINGTKRLVRASVPKIMAGPLTGESPTRQTASAQRAKAAAPARGGAPARCRGFYLHSCATRSRACDTPLSEKLSVDCVPLAETPLTTALSPPRMASTILASSVPFLIQAPSCWV